MSDEKETLVYDSSRGFDPMTAIALMNNNGWGGMNNPMWMMFMYPFILPFINGMYGNGWGGNFGGMNGGAGFLANQLNNDAGRELICKPLMVTVMQ